MASMGSKDIAADIAARIVRGDWVKGDPLPITKDLAAAYGVGERTIDAAMTILIIRGIVRGVRGGRRYVV